MIKEIAIGTMLLFSSFALAQKVATDAECHKAVNDEKFESGIVTRITNEGINYGEETCGYVLKDSFAPLYWINFGKVCVINESDFDQLVKGESAAALARACETGRLPIIKLHPMPTSRKDIK